MTDERDAHDVRAWLATAEAPGLRLDLRDTLQAGRRRARQRRNRRIAGGGALVLAAVLAVPGTATLLNRGPVDAPPAVARRTPPPDGPFSCTYRALPVPPGLDTIDRRRWHLELEGMDPSGRYVVAQAMGGDVAAPRVPVLWDNGVARLISPDLRGRPMAVSEKGVVAGERMPGTGTWIYRDGVVRDLPLPAGATGAQIRSINADGDLLGVLFTTAPNTMRVAVWPADDLANPRLLDAPGEVVHAVAFLPDGGVVGWQDMANRPYVWTADGVGTAYPAPPGALEHRLVGVGDGYVYGMAKRTAAENLVPIRWKLGTGAVEWLQAPAVTPAADAVLLEQVGGNGAQLLLAANRTGTGVFDTAIRTFVRRGDRFAQLPAPEGMHASGKLMDEFGTKAAGLVSSPDNGSAGGTANPAIWTC